MGVLSKEYLISLTALDIELLRALAELPDWIIDDWVDKYGECNCYPLPIETVKDVLKQIDKQEILK